MIPFGQILQRLRNEKRWSQSKLAEKLGLSASQVANYEMGRRLPSLQILIDMARILGVSTDYLLGVENETKQILDALCGTFAFCRKAISLTKRKYAVWYFNLK